MNVNYRFYKLSLLTILLIFSSFSYAKTHDWMYFFDHPAKYWEESIPLGNGRIGMMPWGGITEERIVLNEISLWSGQVQDADNPQAFNSLAPIRQLLFEGKNDQAQELMYKTFTCKGKGSAGGEYGAYQNFGNLYLHFEYPDSSALVTHYRRELNLSKALSTTTFTKGNIRYQREYFTSFSNDIGIIRLTASKSSSISFGLKLSRDEKYSVQLNGKLLTISGQLSGDGVHDNGMKFLGAIDLTTTGGQISYEKDRILVKNATTAEIHISLGTNYHHPDFESHTLKLLAKARQSSYEATRSAHQKTYQQFFNRVNIELPANTHSTLPIDKRLETFHRDSTDADLAALYFQNGRYLLISSTRIGGLPPNLQGLWAPQVHTPWNGDYHLNINLQMNLWPSETTNLSELHLPTIQYIQSLAVPGEKTARIYYNSRGWVTHILGNVWGFTSPSEDPSWGATNTAGAWLCQDLWEHYLFTKDTNYLKTVYPTMKGAAQFFSDMLVKDPRSGYLVTSPTTSPENQYVMQNGKKVSICAGSTMDHQLVRELFSNTIAAAQLLKKDTELIDELSSKRKLLPPTSIGKYGQIMEWTEDYTEADPHHRHVSQMYGLFPGNELTYEKTPELMKAAKATLERRGDQSTGWSMAWKINFWARLKDGNRAYKLIHDLFKPAGNGQGTYPNLFSAHPPMQIDGNFGATAGIAEMLVQSQGDCIELLPALPSAWKTGKVTGLKVRGGGIISLEWENNKINSCSIKATADHDFAIQCPTNWNTAQYTKSKNVRFENGKLYVHLHKGETFNLNNKNNDK